MHLILYSKPGCHLCEGLQEKLEQIQSIPIQLEVRDITTHDEWFQAFQYTIPVLFWNRDVVDSDQSKIQNPKSKIPSPSSLIEIPRFSPRASVAQVEQMLQKFILENTAK